MNDDDGDDIDDVDDVDDDDDVDCRAGYEGGDGVCRTQPRERHRCPPSFHKGTLHKYITQFKLIFSSSHPNYSL